MDPLLGLYSYARPTRIYRKQKNRPPFVFRNFFLFLLAVWRCWYVSYAQLDSIIRIVYEFYIPHFLRLENRIWRNKSFFEIVRNKDRVINLIKRLMGICFFFFFTSNLKLCSIRKNFISFVFCMENLMVGFTWVILHKTRNLNYTHYKLTKKFVKVCCH